MRRLIWLVPVLLAAVFFVPPMIAGPLGWRPAPLPRAASARLVTLADGRTLNVVDSGEGTPIVLVHGLPSHLGEWEALTAALHAVGPYRVIAYDRAGFGYSTREPAADDPYTLLSNARELSELLDALAVEQAALVGWSYGGGVVQVLAQQQPERVSHVILVASVGPSISMEGVSGSAENILASSFGESIIEWVGSVPPLADAMARQNLGLAFAREEEIPDGWIANTRSALALPGTLRSWRLETLGMDLSLLHPERIAAPSLVIQGADDYLVAFSVGEDLDRRLPNSRFVPVLSGSHMIPVTHAEVLAAEIHDLIRAY